VRRRADELEDDQRAENDAAADVGEDVELPEDVAEDRAGENTPGRAFVALQHAERRRRDEQPENHHSAQPHDQRDQRGVTDRNHPVIIIAGLKEPLEAIAWVTDRSLDALAREEPIDPYAVTLLLRRYVETGRADLADAVGGALACALDAERRAPPPREAAWLMTFAEAATLSDDDRLRMEVADLVAKARHSWGRVREVEELAWSVDACLSASDVFEPRKLVPAAIDQLESIVADAYRPGDGVAQRIGQADSVRGRLGDQVRTASALLAAYQRTSRVPYAMLAEELMQYARRMLWTQDGGFLDWLGDGTFVRPDEKPFALNCEAARVFRRLAALHGTDEYREIAIIAPDADYRRDATETLASVGARYRDYGAAAAIYAITLAECHRIDD
jgi:hypothetical protein